MAIKSKEAKPKRPPKTLKEKRFVKAYLETGNATQAALSAYDATYHSARRIGSENVAKLSFDHYFEKAGLTDEVISQNIAVMALTAKKRDQYSGEISDDYSTKLKATELALKVMKKLGNDSANLNATVNNFNVTWGG